MVGDGDPQIVDGAVVGVDDLRHIVFIPSGPPWNAYVGSIKGQVLSLKC
jgi:hypothetical protein